MDEVRIGIFIGVTVAVLSPFLVVGVRYLGRVVADNLRDGLVGAVQLSLSNEIRSQVHEAVDDRFQTMEHRIADIHHELRDNGGDSLKDAIRRIEARQSKDQAERRDSMTKVWETLAKHGIERRQTGEDPA